MELFNTSNYNTAVFFQNIFSGFKKIVMRTDCKSARTGITGKCIVVSEINNKTESIDVSGLAEGIYYLIVKNNNEIIETRKISIVR